MDRIIEFDDLDGWEEEDVVTSYEYPTEEGYSVTVEVILQSLDHDGKRYYRWADRDEGTLICHEHGPVMIDRDAAIAAARAYAAECAA